MEDKMCLSCYLEAALQFYKEVVVNDLAASFHESCPVCEGTAYSATGDIQAFRDHDLGDDPNEDFVAYPIWLVCNGCRSIFDTYDLFVTMSYPLEVQGKLDLIKNPDKTFEDTILNCVDDFDDMMHDEDEMV